MYGGGIDHEKFRKLKLFSTEYTIRFNHLFKLDKIKNKQFDRKNIWRECYTYQ